MNLKRLVPNVDNTLMRINKLMEKTVASQGAFAKDIQGPGILFK